MNFKKVIEEFNKKWIKKSDTYINNPEKTKGLLAQVSKMLSKDAFKDVFDDLKSIYSYVKDITTGRYKDYSVANLAMALGVLIYVVSPLDVIPDFIVGLGLADDAFLVGWACKQLHEELSKYRAWKSND